ncbi:WS/DGAT domain-containing protein [Rhodococcus sp. MEB064]|uniref:WS/DGAT domain-containing protein n=1 Tax=Rhodococcus sp. MEB064 TaxID=1587522 RepID=UPI0005AC54C5|nr:WS/DGAT domain-containing protein [Rhodococcus sp. MEB064]KIQ19873.1 hypothetical protein RU01_02965 [Rhodococcus sp. MEB064]
MATTRLDPKDAAFHYQSRPGSTTDHYITTALDHGSTGLRTETLVSAIADRADAIAALRVRLSVPTLNLDYPSWTARETPMRDDIVVHADRGLSWGDTPQALGAVLATPVDTQRTSWRVHVLPDVLDVPSSTGPATVVVVQLAHCVTDGSGAVAITRALLGDDSVADDLPTPAVRKAVSPHVAAAAGLLRLPGQIVGTARAVRRSLRSARDLHRDVDAGLVVRHPAPRSVTMFNDDPGPDRVGYVLVRSLSEVTGASSSTTTGANARVSVTTASIGAIARAMAAFLREQGHDVPDDLGTHVSVALPDDAEFSGVNRLASANVDLFPASDDRSTQSLAIAKHLAEERVRATHQAVLDAVRVADHLPAAVLRQGIRRMSSPRTHAAAHTVVSSVRCGPSDLTVAGTRSLFMTAFAGLGPTTGLTHTVFGLGDTLAIGVLASPKSVPAHRRYVELLSDAIDGG